MKIATRIMLSVISWTLIVLFLQNMIRLSREVDLLEDDLHRECLQAGRLVVGRVGSLWRKEGPQSALSYIRSLPALQSDVLLRIVDISNQPRPKMKPLLERTLMEHAMLMPLRGFRGKEPRIVTYLRIPQIKGVALEMSASLEREQLFVWRATKEFFVLMLIISVVSALLSVWLGRHWVTKRVTQMIELARAAALGAPTQPLPLHTRDDLGELAEELNLMYAELQSSRMLAQKEASQREELWNQLRHTDRLATVGVLLARVAHEIGTPLAVLQGRLHRALVGLEEGSTPRNEVSIALEQGKRVEAIIRSMLQYTRKQSTRGQVQASEMLSRVIDFVEPLAQRRGVHCALEEDTSSCTLRGDLLSLEQAFVNLLLNALYVSPEGGVVRLGYRCPCAETEARGALIKFWIEDQGPGVPEEDWERIFDAFFTTKPSGEGTGMGLAIARNIVREHGGDLSVCQSQGSGARFELTLPAIDEQV